MGVKIGRAVRGSRLGEREEGEGGGRHEKVEGMGHERDKGNVVRTREGVGRRRT